MKNILTIAILVILAMTSCKKEDIKPKKDLTQKEIQDVFRTKLKH